MVDNYLDQLLMVNIPLNTKFKKYNDYDNENDTMIATVLCMSLESIKFLCMISISNLEYFNNTQPSFAKYLNRIRNAMKTPDAIKIFTPNQTLFSPIAIQKNTENKEKVHYIIIQEYCFTDKSEIMLLNEPSQKLLCDLLGELHLEEYYQKSLIFHTEINNPDIISDIIEKTQEYPDIFLVPPKKINKIKIICELLKSNIKNGIDLSFEKIMQMCEAYENAIHTKEIKENEVAQNMQNTINLANSYTRKIIDASRQLETETIPGLLANLLIDMKGKFPFFIDKMENPGFATLPQVGKLTPGGPPNAVLNTQQKKYFYLIRQYIVLKRILY